MERARPRSDGGGNKVMRRRMVTDGDRFVVVVYVTSSNLFSSDHGMAAELSDRVVLVAGQYLIENDTELN
ncbi:uncharacterized protein ARMOST_14468 [Armillaria ostoyae]|uniref:Uncharacterized protein n=1 Tax=Armillaria ostoyae TaxID=47428 RepID=A0A284RQM4_ARMOS|nr:uncharacterized protein ARMOST_14468 [Armillaria ostoyae]